jgi:hypothetical protein
VPANRRGRAHASGLTKNLTEDIDVEASMDVETHVQSSGFPFGTSIRSIGARGRNRMVNATAASSPGTVTAMVFDRSSRFDNREERSPTAVL